jgi:signal transduction histidine kinase
VWSVSPKNDTLHSLCSYLCQFALEYFRDTRTRCRVHTADDIPHSALTPEARHHLFLTAQEAMNKALKHSGAAEVQLSMQMRPTGFEIAIADNGHGFDVAGAGNSNRNGVRNMQARLAEVGGQLDIESSKEGTLVRIRLPIRPGAHPHAGNGTS